MPNNSVNHEKLLHEIEPRVSVLEKGQEAIQRDLLELSTSVKEQGIQLTNAITRLSDNHNSTYNSLADKISNINKTDWQSFWTMIGTLCLIVAAIMAPVWTSFAYYNEKSNELKYVVDKHLDRELETVLKIGKIEALLEVLTNEKNDSRLQESSN